jgi:hypothetical protein
MSHIWVRCGLVLVVLGALTGEAFSKDLASVIALESVVLTPGETIRGTVILDAPSPCNGYVSLVLRNRDSTSSAPPRQNYFMVDGEAAKGDRRITISSPIPMNNPGGDFEYNGHFLNCHGSIGGFAIDPSGDLHVTILPTPAARVYLTQIKIDLTVEQKRLLETNANEVDKLLVDFVRAAEKHSDTSDDQGRFLISTIEAAQSLLKHAEKDFQMQILKPNQPMPLFFRDFREHYRDLREKIESRKLAAGHTASLIFVQLKSAQLKTRQGQKAPVAQLPATASPDARATAQLIADNERAYKYVDETGGATFTTPMSSIPAGARVYYRRTTQAEFVDYPTPTNVPAATFPMAYLDLKFHKDGCGEDQFLHVNPWDNSTAPIRVEWTKCR